MIANRSHVHSARWESKKGAAEAFDVAAENATITASNRNPLTSLCGMFHR